MKKTITTINSENWVTVIEWAENNYTAQSHFKSGVFEENSEIIELTSEMQVYNFLLECREAVNREELERAEISSNIAEALADARDDENY